MELGCAKLVAAVIANKIKSGKEREINEEYKYNLTHHPKERIGPHRNPDVYKRQGQCHARPFSIMVRFPGNFFETELPHQVYLNQLLLVAASILLMFIAVWMWKRRRVY